MMSVWDWLIVILPTAFVLGMGLYSRRYLRDVTTFLSAGRVCGRYVISVGDVASSLSIIGLVSYVEIHYKTGFATALWTSLLLPVGVVLGLFGYVLYRFRETKSQSIGQFIEMRYSRKLRIFAAALRSLSEMLANMIMPALAARFFIYFLGLPHNFMLFGIEFSTFHVIMFVCLFMAISIICMGGAMSIIITDTIQGFICYPMLVFFTIFVLVKFPWNSEMLPVMADRAPGESCIDGYAADRYPAAAARQLDRRRFFFQRRPFAARTENGELAGYLAAGSRFDFLCVGRCNRAGYAQPCQPLHRSSQDPSGTYQQGRA